MQQIVIGAEDRPVRKRKAAAKKGVAKRAANRKPKYSAKSKQSGPGFISSTVSILSTLMGLISAMTPGSGKPGTKKTKTAKLKPSARRRAQKGWYRYAVIGGLIFAVTAPVGVAGYYIVQNSLIEKTAMWIEDLKTQTVASLGLTIQEISMTGRERTTTTSLMKALSIKRGDSILEFDPEATRLRVEKLGWVETASVMRRFPDEIFVRITERRPFARWQLNGKTSVIDRNGAIVTATDKTEFQYLPKIVGVGANEQAAELFDLLAKSPNLFTRLHNAVRIRDRRWNLEFDTGVTVLLPEEGSTEAWLELDRMQQEKKVLNKGVMAIDLRSSEKIYVRLRPDDAEMRRDHGKET